MLCFLYCDGDHRDLHVPTHAFPNTPRFRSTCSASPLANRSALTPATPPSSARSNCRNSSERERAPCQYSRHWRPLVRMPHCTVSSRSEEHTSELQSLMRISYAVFCLKKKNQSTHSINYVTTKL